MAHRHGRGSSAAPLVFLRDGQDDLLYVLSRQGRVAAGNIDASQYVGRENRAELAGQKLACNRGESDVTLTHRDWTRQESMPLFQRAAFVRLARVKNVGNPLRQRCNMVRAVDGPLVTLAAWMHGRCSDHVAALTAGVDALTKPN